MQTSRPKQLGQSKPNFVFMDLVFVRGGGQMYMLYTLIGGGGGGANVQYLFESGGKCPPLLIIRGADILIYLFS